MPRFSANLTMMFNEWSFLDRFAAAADAGFTAVEYLFPYNHKPDEIADRLARNHLVQALFNFPPGNWDAGDRGLAALPTRKDELRASIDRALPYAEATGVKRLHLMAGNASRVDPAAVGAYREAVKYAADAVGRLSKELLLEPINWRDMPGYFIDSFAFTVELIEEVRSVIATSANDFKLMVAPLGFRPGALLATMMGEWLPYSNPTITTAVSATWSQSKQYQYPTRLGEAFRASA